MLTNVLPLPDSLPFELEFLSGMRGSGVTVFGAGGFAQGVLTALKKLDVEVHAVVVSRAATTSLDGIAVHELAALSPALLALPMLVAVFNHRPECDFGVLAATLQARGVSRVYLPQVYFDLIAGSMGWRYWLTERRHYLACWEDLQRAFELLVDAQSRVQFVATLNFRLGLSELSSPAPCPEPQYLIAETQLHPKGNGELIAVDGGAYDGDTLRELGDVFSLARAYAFEPDARNFGRLVQNVKDSTFPVTCIPCGLSDKNQTLSFSAPSGEATSIIEGGPVTIPCVRLDDCLHGERVDYVKLDIEGHELAALTGMEETITRERPILAVAAYHRWDDLWRIPLLLASLRPDYRLRYRIHAHNTFDGVFYAL